MLLVGSDEIACQVNNEWMFLSNLRKKEVKNEKSS